MRALASLILTAGFMLTPLGCAAAQDRTDYCRYGRQSSLFLIDRTTPYDDTDQHVLLESAGAIVDGLGIGDRLVVVTIGAHYSMSRRAFNECRPGCPETTSPLGDLATGCAAMSALREERLFRARLIAALRPLMRNTTDDIGSDITGAIAQATRQPPRGRAYANVFIFSDMLENSQALPWRQFAQQSAAQSLSVVTRFDLTPAVRGANVRIVGFGRLHDAHRSPLPAELDQRIRGFWASYFHAGAARGASFESSIAP